MVDDQIVGPYLAGCVCMAWTSPGASSFQSFAADGGGAEPIQTP